MHSAVAKMLFRLPDAAAVTETRPPTSCKALAARMPNAQPTRLRQSQRPDRGRQPLEGLDLHRHRRARRPEPGDQPRGRRALGERQDEYIADQEMVVVDGYIGNDPDVPHARAALHRGGEREHRRHAAAALLLARRRRGAGAELTVIYTPNLKAEGYPDDRLIAVDLEQRRHARPQLRLLRRVEEGRPADVEQARLRPRRDPAARRLQDHPDRARRRASA